MQNNRFYNALITRWLCNSFACEKYLHLSRLFSPIERRVPPSIFTSPNSIPLLVNKLFVPCKQQADATYCVCFLVLCSCFYLANSRQMQLPYFLTMILVSCFYLANSRQMQPYCTILSAFKCCFYLANSRQMQPTQHCNRFTRVVFTLQTAGRCNEQSV